jgi:hypothetical protein
MNEDELAAIESRCAAATPGPWKRHASMIWAAGENTATLLQLSEPRASRYVEHVPLQLGSKDLDEQARNGDFITAAREDVPALVAEVRRLQALVCIAHLCVACGWRLTLSETACPHCGTPVARETQ